MGTPDVDPETRLEACQSAFRGPQGFARRLGYLFVGLLAFLLATLGARIGTDMARAGSALALVLVLGALVVASRLLRRKWHEPRLALYHCLRKIDEARAARAARAYQTWSRLETAKASGESGGESPELARIHVSRVLDGFAMDAIRRSGTAARRRIMRFVIPVALGCLSLMLFWPLSLFEGIDVLLARKGVGPFPIAYVAGISVTAELPTYLDGTGKKRHVNSELTTVPQGSEVEVRVIPQAPGRHLLLTDGLREVPLVSDGQGGLVARWKAEDASLLRVAARFGDVLLFDGHETVLAPLEDRAPHVSLRGTPTSRELAEIEELELAYLAVDDHGLTQVELVITSGQRSHRQELVHLDGQKQTYAGAYRLTRDHEMLRRAFLPIRVSIEAKDGNTATGPNWGKSGAITLLPEPLGRAIAQRHRDLRAFRQALTAYLAADIAAAHLSLFEAREAREKAHAELGQRLGELRGALSLGSDFPGNSLSFLEAQVEALSRKGVERSSSEAVLLAADALIHNMAETEAQALARDLGSAVEELAVQARELRFGAQGISLEGLFDLVRGVDEGAAQLREVGTLGLDLGSVARGDLARIETNLKKKEYDRAEAAALHLAERLKRATPSFGSKGGGSPGVESGSGQGSPGPGSPSSGAASEAPSDFEKLSREVDSLAQESAAELSELERLLREAREAAEADFEPDSQLADATDELRQALSQLPGDASSPDGPRSEAASARGHGEAMAEALDANDLLEAIERGVDAAEALRRAKKMLEQQPGWMDPESLQRAQTALEKVLQQARSAAEQLAEQQDQEIGESLGERAERQRSFAERAKSLANRGRDPSAPLSEESIEALKRASRLMEQAASEMDAKRANGGADLAAEAQTELERALRGQQSPSAEARDSVEGDSREMSNSGSVPEEERDRARRFRERVEKGLGRGSGHLSPAVRRYAEELK